MAGKSTLSTLKEKSADKRAGVKEAKKESMESDFKKTVKKGKKK